MGKIVDVMITTPAGAGNVPAKKMGLKRFPFVFLIDVSGSTGTMPDPDINHINSAIAQLLETLRRPTPSSDLAAQIDVVDVCIVAYSDTPTTILPWSTVENLPVSLQPLVPLAGTATARGIEFALERIAERLRWYRDPSRNIGSGMPHIIHLTDGAMTDAVPGDARWSSLQSSLTQIDGRANPEKKIATMLHFVSPKGCVAGWIDVGGRRMSGQELLAELTGAKSVYEMGREISSFEALVSLITVVITKITKNFNAADAVSAGLKAVPATKMAS